VIGTGNQLLNDGTNTYTYDKNGNTLTKTNTASGDVWYYTWNYKNQMTSAVEKTSSGTVLQSEQYTYDVEGRLIGVNVNGTQQRWTVFDGSNPYMDFNGAGMAVTMWYVTNPSAYGTFYARVSASGSTNWYVTDMLGSVRQIVDTGGNTLDAIVYDPWGNIVNESNAANGDRFKFDGGEYDAIQQTYLFNARWLNPQDGRWVSPDPLGFGAEDSNLYRYVFNNPADHRDPTGLSSALIPFSDFINGLQDDLNTKFIHRVTARITKAAANIFNTLKAGYFFKVTDQEDLRAGDIASVNPKATLADRKPNKGTLKIGTIGWSWSLDNDIEEVEIDNKANPKFARFEMQVRLDISTTAAVVEKEVQLVFEPFRWFFITGGSGWNQNGTIAPRSAPVCNCGCTGGANCMCPNNRAKPQ
jgi:RHS repeat-associated protein